MLRQSTPLPSHTYPIHPIHIADLTSAVIDSLLSQYNNNGDLVPSYTSTDTSDSICPVTNAGTCPVVTTTSVAPPPASQTPTPPAQSGRRIHPNGNNGKCLDVQGAKYQDGTPVRESPSSLASFRS